MLSVADGFRFSLGQDLEAVAVWVMIACAIFLAFVFVALFSRKKED